MHLNMYNNFLLGGNYMYSVMFCACSFTNNQLYVHAKQTVLNYSRFWFHQIGRKNIIGENWETKGNLKYW